MKKDNDGIIRKRSLIEKARKNVLYWVAGAASVMSAVIVVSIMLVQAAMFNQSVLSEKNQTLRQIRENIQIAPDLKADIRKLDTNEELRLVRPNEDASALQTILDALPADENRLALGASLQKRIFEEAPGVKIDALSVDPSSGTMVVGSDDGRGLQQVSFAATISGSPDALKQAMNRLERSIRAFNVTTITGTTQDTEVSLQITGVAYYFPPANLALTTREETQE